MCLFNETFCLIILWLLVPFDCSKLIYTCFWVNLFPRMGGSGRSCWPPPSQCFSRSVQCWQRLRSAETFISLSYFSGCFAYIQYCIYKKCILNVIFFQLFPALYGFYIQGHISLKHAYIVKNLITESNHIISLLSLYVHHDR